MRGKLRTIIGSLLLIVGVCLIGTTIWMKYETKKQQQDLLDSFKNLEITDNNETSNAYNDSNNESNNNKNSNNKKQEKAIALLNILKLNLEVGIVDGVSTQDIKFAVGHFPKTAMPGQKGNFAIAGHRVSNYGQPFRHIEELVPGDEIKITYKGKEYIYEMIESFEVTPDDVHVLDSTEEPTITIVTCTIGAKKRVIVKGKLK